MGSQSIQGKLWGTRPKGWAEIQEPKHKPLWEAMLNAAQVGTGTIFLDVGCGAEGASIIAQEGGAIIYGIDAAKGLLAFAERNIPCGDFQVDDIENLPYPDSVFDVVFAANSTQYSEDRIAALKELERVCKPNGRIVAGLFGAPEQVDYRIIFKALRDAMPDGPKEVAPSNFQCLGC